MIQAAQLLLDGDFGRYDPCSPAVKCARNSHSSELQLRAHLRQQGHLDEYARSCRSTICEWGVAADSTSEAGELCCTVQCRRLLNEDTCLQTLLLQGFSDLTLQHNNNLTSLVAEITANTTAHVEASHSPPYVIAYQHCGGHPIQFHICCRFLICMGSQRCCGTMQQRLGSARSPLHA